MSPVTYQHAEKTGVSFHPLCTLFPEILGPALTSLRNDIDQNGVREPIVFLDGAILDGRNRYMIARELGQAYPRRDFGSLPSDGNDPRAYVISQNLARRHLSESQRSMIAAKIANMRSGARTDIEPPANLPEVAQTDAAEMMNVSERSLRTAKTVQDQGVEGLPESVDRGEVSVSAAAIVASLPEEEQRETIEAGPDAIKQKAKEVRQAKKRTNSLSSLTRDGLEEEVSGLREENAELRTQNQSKDREIKSLKDQVKSLSQSDHGRIIGRLTKERDTAKGRMGEYQQEAARLGRRVKHLENECDQLRKDMESQEIAL